jgi:imidazolonepropionase-like amidohydrolase
MAAVKHGEALHRELEPFVDAGLSKEEALRAATILAAEWFRLGDRGAIAVGKRADMVLVGRNPVDDIAGTINVERVWIAGGESRWGEKIV